MALKKKMALRKRSSPPPPDSVDSEQPLQNDVAQEVDAASESEKSSPKPSGPSVKRTLTVDETHKYGSKPDPKPTRKRENDKGGNKKARVENETVEKARVSNKESGVNRLWSEEDELVLLHGIIDYRLAKNKDPHSHSDYEAFLEFVRDSLQINVSIKQLRDKIRKLRNKYLAKADKGDDVVFVKPHDDKLFELSEKAWGGGNGGGRKNKDTDIGKPVVNDGVNEKDDVVIENGVEVDDDEEENGSMDFKEMCPYPYSSEVWESDVSFPQPLKDISVRNFTLVASEKMRALEKEWKDVFVKDLQLNLKKLDLKTKLAKLVLAQMISSDP